MAFPVASREHFDAVFNSILAYRAQAIMSIGDPLLLSERKRLIEFAHRNRLPTSFGMAEFTADGGIVSYGPNSGDITRRSAAYLDKILRGAKPGDLPVEQPTKYELVVNLKAAKALGLTIPPSLLLRADQVIE